MVLGKPQLVASNPLRPLPRRAPRSGGVILLFGAGGQLGQELACAARTQSIPVRAFDRSEADITNPRAVAEAITRTKASMVVNAAAYTAVDKAETESDEAKRVNQTGPAILAEA